MEANYFTIKKVRETTAQKKASVLYSQRDTDVKNRSFYGGCGFSFTFFFVNYLFSLEANYFTTNKLKRNHSTKKASVLYSQRDTDVKNKSFLGGVVYL